jgi:hypothetical protein
MIAILCTDGVLKLSDIYAECKKQKWVPILVYRKKNAVKLEKKEMTGHIQPDDQTPIVIAFENDSIAKKFAKRNTPKGWLRGAVLLADEDVENIKAQGWKIEIFTWPRKLNPEDVEIGFEVINLTTHPDVYCSR